MNEPTLAVTPTSGAAHIWTTKDKQPLCWSFCGLTRFKSDLRYGFKGYETCSRCLASPRAKSCPETGK